MDAIEANVVQDGRKSDERGRRITGDEERERAVDAYLSSGMTQRAFCRREGLNYHTFVTWLAKRRQSGGGSGIRFQELQLAPAVKRPGALLEVELASGELVRGSDAQALAELVGLLTR